MPSTRDGGGSPVRIRIEILRHYPPVVQWSMLAVLFSVILVSFSGVMLPGPMFAVALAKSFKSPWTGVQMSIGHAIVEVPIILVI